MIIKEMFLHPNKTQTALVVEEAGVPGENHRPWANNW
jgi:hypothetical protein